MKVSGSEVISYFWDIQLAGIWNTTPWDVRANATVDDIQRQSIWSKVINDSEKSKTQAAKRSNRSK